MTPLPCAIYTRKSSEEGLEQGFNSLDAQREACEAFILSQKTQGWKAAGCYDDGGFSGGNVERPGLQRLLADIALKRIRVVVVYKVDRLTRSLADFAKLVELFDSNGVSFVSVTQQFNTTSSMGRLTLNVLLSFAQFEREVTGERIRDKIAASKKKGMWMGGFAPLGYVPHERSLAVDEEHAQRVRDIFSLYLELGGVDELKRELDQQGWVTPVRQGKRIGGGRQFSRGHLYRLLANPIYVGQISHKGEVHPGLHPAIVDPEVWKAVQDRLAENLRGNRNQTNAKAPSLLTGLVYDENGIRLQPSHSTKGSKRYRYYFRAAQSGAQECKALRIPASELEDGAVGGLIRFLRDSGQIADQVGRLDAADLECAIDAGQRTAAQLEAPGASTRIEVLNRIVERIVVTDKALEIEVRKAALIGRPVQDHDDDPIKVIVPVQVKRSGQALRLIICSSYAQKAQGLDLRLIALLTKAQRWFAMLSSGRYPSVLAIANEHAMATAHVTRVIYLAFLAPDIVRKITEGRQPAGFGTKRLLEMAPLPLDWADQRKALGFTG